MKAHPGIAQLIKDLESAYRNRGHLKGIDGRPLYIRSEHKLLNTLLQNAATMVFKNWMLECDEHIPSNTVQTIAMHDELQYEVRGTREEAEDWGHACEVMASEVGIKMNIRVPIAAKGKVGRDWCMTH